MQPSIIRPFRNHTRSSTVRMGIARARRPRTAITDQARDRLAPGLARLPPRGRRTVGVTLAFEIEIEVGPASQEALSEARKRRRW